jgi:hypothetical protein
MIIFGWGGLFVTGAVLSFINWRSRDFNLKSQRRQIRLVNPPQGQPAVSPKSATNAATTKPATSEGGG